MPVLDKDVERQQRVAPGAGPLLGCCDEGLANAAPSCFWCDDQVGDVSAFAARVIVRLSRHVYEPQRLATGVFRNKGLNYFLISFSIAASSAFASAIAARIVAVGADIVPVRAPEPTNALMRPPSR